MQTATADPLVGRTLEGRYRIEERIARGGMSTVYAAVDERLDRRVAVKVMSAALSADPKFSDRFAHEAQAAARLSHVNTVAVYDQGLDTSAGHHVFLVMELVRGRTLRDLIRERTGGSDGGGRFTPAEAVSIMEPVLSALSAAHRAGLVHRDIKPENILLSDDGLVKVADFGLARAVDTDPTAAHTGLMMGTVAYCAPEQVVHGRAEPRSDVYSAGIVLFELLTGRPPYQGESAMQVAYQHVHSRVPAPSSRVRGIPTPVDEIVVAATDSDPSGRPPDAATMLAELADARAELALPVVPIPPRHRGASDRFAAPSRPAAARRGAAEPAAATAPADRLAAHDTIVAERPVGGAGQPPPPVVIPPSRRARVSPRARRRRRRLVVFVVLLLLGAASAAAGVGAVRLYHEWNTHVPKLAGLSAADARSTLHRTGYAIDPSVTDRFSETVPKGSVIGTEPAAGHRLPQGRAVRLIVSLGKDRIAVPDVTHRAVGDAETVLQARGLSFDPNYATQHSISVRSGDVISTDPGAGALIKRNAQVRLVVSSGLPTVDVPHIDANTPFDQAKALLEKAHFSVTRTSAPSESVPAGDVVSVSPADRAVYGSTVTLETSSGPPMVAVPDVSSLEPYSQLAGDLQQAGLVPDVKKWLGGVEGRVVRISPGSGTLLPKGSTVTVWVV